VLVDPSIHTTQATGGAALGFTWTTDEVSPAALEGLGYEVLSLHTLQRTLIKQAKLAGPHRTDVRNASHRVLELMVGARPLAIVDVDLSDPASLQREAAFEEPSIGAGGDHPR